MIPAHVGRDDTRALAGTVNHPPLERLARYEPGVGTGPGKFVRVSKADLAQAKRVVVFVHGWVRGGQQSADKLFAETGRASAWDATLSNATGRPIRDTYLPLLESLTTADPDSVVLWFSWVDQSSTDTEFFAAQESFRLTAVNGRRLAIALHLAFGDGNPAVHIIGHSHGCVVSTHASLSLTVPPKQLTLLDCPEDWFSRADGAAGLLSGLLPRLKPGRGSSGIFVDNYISMFGRRYHGQPDLHNVVDVHLKAGLPEKNAGSPIAQAHLYAVRWYAETIVNQSDYGYHWSPLRGFDTSSLAADYEEHGEHREHSTLAPKRLLKSRLPSQPKFHTEPVDLAPQLITTSSPNLDIEIDAPKDAILIEYDVEFNDATGPKTHLQIALNHTLKGLISPRYPVPARGRYLRLISVGDPITLQFRLIDGQPQSQVTVTGLRVVSQRHAQRNYNEDRAVTAVASSSAAIGMIAGAAVALAGVAAVAMKRGWRPFTRT